jgi:hypothetical protein
MILPAEVGKKLLDLRLKFGQFFIYRLNNQMYIFRPLSIGELKAIESLNDIISEYCLNDWVIEKTYIYGDYSLDELLTIAPAGIIDSIAPSLLQKSLIPEEELESSLEEGREKAQRLDNQLKDSFLTTYKSDIKNADSLSMRELINYVARSEIILDKKISIGKQSKKSQNKGADFSYTSTQNPDTSRIGNFQADDPFKDIESGIFDGF